jgi:predicted nucleic acid-binding protein
MTLIYIDTNIYLNFLLERSTFAEEAFDIFKRAMRCEFEIIISSKILEELYGNIEFEKTKMLITMLKPKLRPVKISKEEIKEAKAMSVHYQDALHALVAHRYHAEYLLTRNIKHFRQYSHLVKPVLPEDI